MTAPPAIDDRLRLTRRRLLGAGAHGLGALALATLLSDRRTASAQAPPVARAKRVIFLCQSGAPSQVDLFDPKPNLSARHGQELPASIRRGQRLTTMTADQATKPIVASPYPFARHGQSGMEVSDLLPHTAQVVDDLCLVRSMYTEAINHDPAITLLQTGSQQPGRPSMGSWLSYALGRQSDDLPTFAVMISGGEPGDQPLNGRLWGSAFLPSQHQGVRFRGRAEPVLYLQNPPGIDAAMRHRLLDSKKKLDALRADAIGDPEIESRIAQFEMAERMQRSVPQLADLSSEPARTFELYGEEARTPGTFAANCLLARRMVERGVRFVQLYHRGWDHHQNLPSKLPKKCRQVDQPSAALVRDLKQSGLLDDTLIVWAGEFGRTVYCQGELQGDDFGRDHHPRCFSIWLAGGGVRAGSIVGRTDDFSYNIVEQPIHIHDLQATMLALLGLDHEQLTYRTQGRDFRLTDIAGRVVSALMA